MNYSIICLFMIICMILISSANAVEGGSHFYTLPDAEMAAKEQQQKGFRTRGSKKSAAANKDWMGAPISRQQSKHSSSNSSLRKNKKKTFEDVVVSTNTDDMIKESIRNDRVSGSSSSSVRTSSSKSRETRTFDFS
ncbi:unnamed protein product [Cylindrotheca closterium]|uniref:Secreted protein n=1 Tax=Cylindrotheca closterium TaxID=2856 RepID=A0AAD2JL58_9STRA|nr:unnamed protein product [Cylindrotheca closterium]